MKHNLREHKNNKTLLIASAGGHLTQALCACSHVDNIVLVTTKALDNDPRISKTYEIWSTQKNAFIHFYNIFYAIYVLLRERPNVVFTTGGPIVLPFSLVCKLLPLRFIYLDTLSRVVELSNTARLIYKYHLYDEIMTQWPEVANLYNVEYAGQCFDLKGKKQTNMGTLSVPDQPLVLVTTGTNEYPFDRLIEIISQLSIYQDPNVRWFIQTGGFTIKHDPACGNVVNMTTRDEMEQLVKESSLVISHCGVGSIHQMLSYQKKVIFIPRLAKYGEFSDDHQLQIASQLNNSNMLVVYPDQALADVTRHDLQQIPRYEQAIDVTNNKFASLIAARLYNRKCEGLYG